MSCLARVSVQDSHGCMARMGVLQGQPVPAGGSRRGIVCSNHTERFKGDFGSKQVLAVLEEGGEWKALGQGVRDVLSACTFLQFQNSVTHHVSEKVSTGVNVATPFRVDRVFRHQDSRGIVLEDGGGCVWSWFQG